MHTRDQRFQVAVRATADGRFSFQIFTVSGEPRTCQADSSHYATPADAAQAGYDAISKLMLVGRWSTASGTVTLRDPSGRREADISGAV
jgi:hypothetical protein